MPTGASARVPWVVKYGGNAMGDPATRRAFAAALAALAAEKGPGVVVHGGGPYIQEGLDEARIESRFEGGRRVTGDDAIGIVENVLSVLGKHLAGEIGDAVALTGRDARVLEAEVADAALGRVGRITAVRTELLLGLTALGMVPVLACLAVDVAGAPLNVNADDVAGAVAGALAAPVAFLTNVPGVLDDPNDPTTLVRELREDDVRARIGDGRIAGGMIPKVEAALNALAWGAPEALIADGRAADRLADALSGRQGTRFLR